MNVKEIIGGTKEVTENTLLTADDWETTVDMAMNKSEDFMLDFQVSSLRLSCEKDDFVAYWTARLFNNLNSFELALYLAIFLTNFGY